MVIAGASGHAIELFEILTEQIAPDQILFLDDVSVDTPGQIFGQRIIRTHEELKVIFEKDPDFVIGVGRPNLRKKIAEKTIGLGGRLVSAISTRACIGKFEVELGEGLNIMQGVVITARVVVGKGTLLHINSNIHHDTIVGEYCEISPGARLLGKSRIGSFVSVGTNAVILPGISVGDNAVIGAGAVVTKDVQPGARVAGVPARKLNK